MKRLSLALLALVCLGMGWFPATPKQRVYVSGGACAAKYELEVPALPKPHVVATGLSAGDCIDLDSMVSVRLCCPVAPRRCGARAAVLTATPFCKRIITP